MLNMSKYALYVKYAQYAQYVKYDPKKLLIGTQNRLPGFASSLPGLGRPLFLDSGLGCQVRS